MMSFDKQLNHLIDEAWKEDIGDGDHSTLASIDPDARGKAVLKIKEDGIVAGMRVAEKIFNYKDASSVFTPFKQDGDEMKYGEKAFEVEAKVHTILQCERLVLNCMQRMSGIATLTKKYTDKLKGYKTKLLDTRKTTPNFRLLEKEAVRIGGGVNHRFGLYDMIMLKDNHIDYCGGIGKAIEKAAEYVKAVKPGLKIEIETRGIDDVKKVIAMGKGKVFRIMLDNFSPSQISEALKLIHNDFETEASGGINLDNIEEYAKTGVDYVSVGALIHQARSLDLSLKASPNPSEGEALVS
ncbi:MAG: carboxylating nicotinate-nucleotide diphosphorylase [Chitinophagaceae bacterium]|nr:carboxylating nicotinate-nucleotide diphosphorylase [Chitinophagaceae bacterium]